MVSKTLLGPEYILLFLADFLLTYGNALMCKRLSDTVPIQSGL
jgi:hypothetical protein